MEFINIYISDLLQYILLGVGSVLFLLVTYRQNWLTKNAAVLTALMVFLIVAVIGMEFLLFPLLFLIIGSLLSRLNPSTQERNGRNFIQVFSNGGPATILLLYVAILRFLPLGFSFDLEICKILFTLNFCAALSDTASSEIGKYFSGKTYDILKLKEVPVGLSGGISISGTLAGLIAAAFMGIITLLILDFSQAKFIFIFGFAGMVIDSILGSLFQSKYKVENSIIEKGKKDQLYKGIHGFNNNTTNFMSLCLTILIAYFFYR